MHGKVLLPTGFFCLVYVFLNHFIRKVVFLWDPTTKNLEIFETSNQKNTDFVEDG